MDRSGASELSKNSLQGDLKTITYESIDQCAKQDHRSSLRTSIICIIPPVIIITFRRPRCFAETRPWCQGQRKFHVGANVKANRQQRYNDQEANSFPRRRYRKPIFPSLYAASSSTRSASCVRSREIYRPLSCTIEFLPSISWKVLLLFLARCVTLP